jgi:hypothetical protein
LRTNLADKSLTFISYAQAFVYFFVEDLSGSYQPAVSGFLSVYAYLLGIYGAGSGKARDTERFWVRVEAHRALPPLGRKWVRPRSVSKVAIYCNKVELLANNLRLHMLKK